MGKDFQLLYINSFQRSGSTILGTLLGRSNVVSYLGEVRNLQDYFLSNKSCFCTQSIRECDFWQPIIQSVGNERLELTKSSYGLAHKCVKLLSLAPSSLSAIRYISNVIPTFNDEFRLLENISEVYKSAYSLEGKPVICDSSHRTTQCRLLYDLYGERLKVISLVRDGRAVVNSVRRRTGSSIQDATRRWVRFHKFQKLSYKGVPDESRLFMRYEDLCVDPKGAMIKVGEFVGVEIKETGGALHFIGGSSTIRNNKLSISTLKLDEKWRNEMTEEDLEVFDKTAGKLNRSFGYE